MAHLRSDANDVKLVSACDKAHNATWILRDLRADDLVDAIQRQATA